MKTPSPNQIAWLLPVTILVHQIEEFLFQFPLWYSDLLNVKLSNQDFLVINGVGLFVFTTFSLSYFFNKNNLIIAALGTLVLVNGIVHLLASIFTLSYSPGTISGLFLFIPLGIVIYRTILPQLSFGEKAISVAIGFSVLFIVSLIAFNI